MKSSSYTENIFINHLRIYFKNDCKQNLRKIVFKLNNDFLSNQGFEERVEQLNRDGFESKLELLLLYYRFNLPFSRRLFTLWILIFKCEVVWTFFLPKSAF